MGRIKILNSSLVEQGIIMDTYSAPRTEKINSDNILNFTAPLEACGSLITGDNIAEVGEDYFDIVAYKKSQTSNGELAISVECEHVSYRLNEPEYNLEYFTQTGTPTAILTQILDGTGFTVGTVDFSTEVTYSAQEAKSRRALLMEFVAYIGGEAEFSKFSISIRAQRGSTTPKDLLIDRNIEVISISFSKRDTDSAGNPLVSYECSLIRPMTIALGDVVTLNYTTLGIDTELRVVSITTDPYAPDSVSFEIGNFSPGLADDAYRIETSTVVKDKLYYGARIGPENGFESIRNDKLARAHFNADNFKMQSGDGGGENWVDKIYFDPATGKYKFNGTLEAADGIFSGALQAATGTFSGSVTIGDEEKKTLIDQYGLDTRFIKWFKNMCYNSSFEVFEPETKLPAYWDGGVSSPNSNFFGDHSLKLTASESSKQTAAINPQWYNSVSAKTRVSFHKKGGAVRVSVLAADNSPFALTDENGDTGAYIECAYNENWIPESYTVSFTHGIGTSIRVKFDNSDSVDAYVDGVIVEPDYTGKRPSFYTDGPNSIGTTTGKEIITVVEATETAVQAIQDGVRVTVGTTFPVDAKTKDVHVKTNDYSRFDKLHLTTATTLAVDANEFITASGTFSITLHAATAAGIIKKIYNVGTGLITLTGTINGVVNMYLYPNESVELITDGTAWRC